MKTAIALGLLATVLTGCASTVSTSEQQANLARIKRDRAMQVAENERAYNEQQAKNAEAEQERLAKDAALAEKWKRFGAGVATKNCGELIGSRSMYLWGEKTTAEEWAKNLGPAEEGARFVPIFDSHQCTMLFNTGIARGEWKRDL